MKKTCTKQGCTMSGIEVETDKADCLSCGTRLRDPLGSLFDNLFPKGTNPFGRS